MRNTPDVARVEGIIPKRYGADCVEIPGAKALLASLEGDNAPWTIVTSGTRPLIGGWAKVMGFSMPKCLVTAEDVMNGKPDPACYLLGKERLGLKSDSAVLVVEDAPAGIRAGKAAGCTVIGLVTTHSVQQVKEAGADLILKDLDSVLYCGRDEGTGALKIETRGGVGG